MRERVIDTPPPALRAAIAASLVPVRPLPAPLLRSLWLSPLALLLVVAAPLVFAVRDLDALGWGWSWGASMLQLSAGIALVAAALREAIPGRSWSGPSLAVLLGAPIALVAVVTVGSWHASPVPLTGSAPIVAVICLLSSAISALPAVALASVLAVRAFPTRPAVCGLLAGAGAGLMADAGWRLFCEFSEPAHVLPAHLGGILLAGLAGASLTRWLSGRSRRAL